MMGMLAELHIPHTGRHHSGIGNAHQNLPEWVVFNLIPHAVE